MNNAPPTARMPAAGTQALLLHSPYKRASHTLPSWERLRAGVDMDAMHGCRTQTVVYGPGDAITA
jgi:hypothetical protein